MTGAYTGGMGVARTYRMDRFADVARNAVSLIIYPGNLDGLAMTHIWWEGNNSIVLDKTKLLNGLYNKVDDEAAFRVWFHISSGREIKQHKSLIIDKIRRSFIDWGKVCLDAYIGLHLTLMASLFIFGVFVLVSVIRL